MLFLAFVDCPGAPNGLGQILGFLDGVLTIIKILVPIALIVFGSVDLCKAVMAGKDEDIKKAQKLLGQRALAAVAVFFLGSIVQLLFGLAGEDDLCISYNDLNPNEIVYEEIA